MKPQPQIASKLIHQVMELEVLKTDDNKYIVTDGSKYAVVDEMPCLNANYLRGLLPVSIDNNNPFQFKQYGNIIPATKRC